ncbi:MAG: Daunorubicin/doxorubicin resistance ABC transporter permease protein DrrB [candidate division TA06 bacterium ADurb.Bin417]|uniref:Transport permease protein n=1 Tax=candidate division TA06 bacterium ADurb.Bin417 TaxID=1852828 RepID=A0A1V5MJX9_UNCT6|nr:MAG: Daunorubicin/doxorubicin resistance ABC transporter permease protein DrrB [candidate division TA06 bacterium ADurb.Bin417]
MTYAGRGKRKEDWGEFMINSILQILGRTFVMAEMETRKIIHDPTELITRAVQPILWIGIFGQALSRIRAIPTQGFTYLQFITPGILTQSVTFVAIFYGLSIIWERDMGLLQKILVTPTPRLALVWGKMLSAGIRGLTQAVIILLFALVLRIQLRVSPASILGVVVITILGAGFFSSLSMIIASIVKTRERFMGIGQIITLPLFFASNAIYPISIMPGWLQRIANLNPLSYMVSGLRALLVTGDLSRLPLDLVVLATATILISFLGAYMYPKVVI